MSDHDFLPVDGHPDDDECTHREDGTDATYCGRTRAEHEHHPSCYQSTGNIPADLPPNLCDCRVLRMIDAHKETQPVSEPINLDPIEPTPIGPGLTAIPLSPTVWDDLPDGQHAVTPNGIVFRRRDGLWHMAPWWQNNGDGAEIAQICADPDEWAYDSGWPRKMVEDAHGPLMPIALPGARYPHDDDRCRQDSVDAAGFTHACRELARLAGALGIADTAQSVTDVVDAAIRRIETQP